METLLEQARSKCSQAVFAENWGMQSEAIQAVQDAIDLLKQWQENPIA